MEQLKVEPSERLLIIAPHPDDESIGCGGLLLKYGCQTDILLVTDGRESHGPECTDEECAQIRRSEFEKAMAKTDVKSITCLDYHDLHAYQSARELRKNVDASYDRVFVPNRDEEHADHRAVNEFVRRILRFRKKTTVYEYEVWGMMPYPDVYLDISDVYEKKQQLIASYVSQLGIRDYHAMVEGMGLYRGVLSYTKYAEAYQRVGSHMILKKTFFKLPINAQRRLKH